MCGEKFDIYPAERRDQGSPPRVRGKVCEVSLWTAHRRITPACAGKSNGEPEVVRLGWDHPRVCGEKACTSHDRRLFPGSPPRVRGKERSSGLAVLKHGITPACAGKRTFSPTTQAGRRDHPRVCGEKHLRNFKWTLVLGSPPRVRGNAFWASHQMADGGITPACAGKSQRQKT